MIIYADVLVCINVLITYIFLVCVRVFTNIPTGKIGVAIASLLGGVSALIIFLGEIGLVFSVGYKLFTAAVIVSVAFLPRRFKTFLKVFLAFFGVSFLFGGAVFFLQFTTSAHNVLYYNGTVYFDMSIKYLVAVVFIIYGIFLAFDYFLSRHAAKNHIYTVSVSFRNVTVKLRGMVDTGNSLKEGISGNPVFVAELTSVLPLFSCEETDFLKSDFSGYMPHTLKNKFRIIPCNTVKGGGLLPGFVPDEITVRMDKKICHIPKVVVAVTTENISDGEFEVLLNKSIYDCQWKERENDEKASLCVYKD